ncbi:MAG: hypothetical protein ABII02_00995 [Candidatus Magasanikbacteria bacterium]
MCELLRQRTDLSCSEKHTKLQKKQLKKLLFSIIEVVHYGLPVTTCPDRSLVEMFKMGQHDWINLAVDIHRDTLCGGVLRTALIRLAFGKEYRDREFEAPILSIDKLPQLQPPPSSQGVVLLPTVENMGSVTMMDLSDNFTRESLWLVTPDT